MTIKIYNLSLNIDDRALAKLFHPYGIVDAAIVDRNALNGRSNGNGSVEMPVEKEARQAIVSLNQTMVDGKPIRVSEWTPTS